MRSGDGRHQLVICVPVLEEIVSKVRDWIAQHTALVLTLFAVPLAVVIASTSRSVPLSLPYTGVAVITAVAIGVTQLLARRAAGWVTGLAIPIVIGLRTFFYPFEGRNSETVFTQATALLMLFILAAIVIALRFSHPREQPFTK
jgi:hypothetical protein